MQFLLEAALSNAVVASVLALVVVVICRFQIRPAARHALWLIVLVKFVTPPLFRLETPGTQAWLDVWNSDLAENPSAGTHRSIEMKLVASHDVPAGLPGSTLLESAALDFELLSNGPEDGTVTESSTQAPFSDSATEIEAAAAVVSVGPATGLVESESDTSEKSLATKATERPKFAINLPAILVTVWIGGSFAWFLVASMRLRAFHRQVGRLLPAGDDLQTLADEVAAELGLRKFPLLRMTDAVVPPMLTLVPNRAVIILPARLLSTLSREQQSAILAHELAHFRRGDQWMRWFEFVVVGLYWWHPAVWYARKELQAAEELCCDAWVVRVFPDQARGYVHALLAAVDFLADVREPAPAEACTLGPISSLKQRLDMILKRKPFPELTPAARLALVALAFIILPWAPELFGQAPEAAPPSELPTTTAPVGALPPQPADEPGSQNLPGIGVSAENPPVGAAPAPPRTPNVPERPVYTPLTQPPSAGNNPLQPPVAPRAAPAHPGLSPSPSATTAAAPAANGYPAPPGATPSAGPQGNSIEERLDRLERMIELFVAKGPAAGQYGLPNTVSAAPVNVPAPPYAVRGRNQDAVRGRSQASWTDDSLAATDRRIRELELELDSLKRRKEALSKIDPNGLAITVIPQENAIRAINTTTRSTAWTFSIDNPESVESATSDGQVVTVKTKDGNTFRLDSKTGRMILGSSTPPAKPATDGLQKF